MARDDFIGLSKAEQKRELDGLEENIELVKAAYGRYFNGVDDRIPALAHDKLKKEFRRMTNRRFRGTDLRFRFNALRSRLISYEQYWNRILHQIEKGSYKRLLSVSRARQRKIGRGEGAQLEAINGSSFELNAGDLGSGGGPIDMDALAAEAEAAVAAVHADRPAGAADESTEAPSPAKVAARPDRAAQLKTRTARARTARPRSSQSSPQLPDGINAKEARQIFKEFVQAKKALGQRTDGLTYGKLVKKLARDVPKLRSRAGDRAVRLEVATVNGKVKLRAKGE